MRVLSGNALRLTLFGLLLLQARQSAQGQVSTAFTYQGRLTDSGTPANGRYDVRCALYESSSGGTNIGSSITNSATLVSNGVFTVLLDFGSGALSPGPCWLELAVRTNGGATDFTVLVPRQALSSSPYAVYAAAVAASGISGSITNEVSFSGGNNQFFGTFSGNGGGLTNINGASLQPGTLNPADLAPATWQGVTNKTVSVINVKNFGARGDGVTDDTLAVSNAWSAWLTSGGTLYFPPGVYLDSGSHVSTNFVSGEPQNHDGRTIRGLGSVVWQYTGTGRLLFFQNSAPDIQQLEFRCVGTATNAIYISLCEGKPALRDLFFDGWANADHGALTIDETDSVLLQNLYFNSCKMGLGLGYRCSNLHGDVETVYCGVGVAVGIPTPTFPAPTESQGIELSQIALYNDTSFALNGYASACKLNLYAWNSTNAVTVGKIPGILTNTFQATYGFTIENSYFNNLVTNGINAAIQLYGLVLDGITIRNTRFTAAAGSPSIVKNYSPYWSAQGVKFDNCYWTGSDPSKAWYEDASGARLSEQSTAQDVYFNRPIGLYNVRDQSGLGGSGYLLDVLDASRAGPLARFGVPLSTDCSMAPVYSGVSFEYQPQRLAGSGGTPDGVVMALTNADLSLQAGALIVETNSSPPVSQVPTAWMLIKTPDGQSWKVPMYQ